MDMDIEKKRIPVGRSEKILFSSVDSIDEVAPSVVSTSVFPPPHDARSATTNMSEKSTFTRRVVLFLLHIIESLLGKIAQKPNTVVPLLYHSVKTLSTFQNFIFRREMTHPIVRKNSCIFLITGIMSSLTRLISSYHGIINNNKSGKQSK